MTPHASTLRSRLLLLLAALALAAQALVLLPQASAAGSPQDPVPAPPYAPGEVLIGWRPGTGPVSTVQKQAGRLGPNAADPAWRMAEAEIRGATGLEVLRARPDHGIARLAVRAGSEAAEIARLRSLPWVRYAELNYYAYAADVAAPAATSATALYPNDPDFGKQWNLHRVKAPDAWSATRGSLSFVVAVLDTGVAQGHPDFAGQLFTGYNYVADQPGAEDDDPFSHGTHVTGILAARTNDWVGVAGLAPDIKVLPLKVLNNNQSGRYDAIAAAIYDATEQRAQVINLSLAATAPSQLLRDAIAYAQAQNALVVAAAGNCAQNPQFCAGQINPDIYPAAYPGVLAVAASDRFDNVAKYSGYKPYIGLAAPGGTEAEPVWSTTRAGYGTMWGTSMATPLVSGAAALAWTLRPAASAQEIAEILRSTADKTGTDPYSGEPLSYMSGRNDYFGSGRLNVANAVRWVYPPSLAAQTGQVSFMLGGASASADRSVAITNPSGQAVYWTATVLLGAPWLSLASNAGISLYATPATVTVQASRLNLAPGIYTGVVRVQPTLPADLAPVDITVQLRVAAALARNYLPFMAQNPEPAWLDPDSPANIFRSVVSLGNDSMTTVGLPFPVRYYGATYQTLVISDNGLVIFGGANGAKPEAPTACPGDGRTPNNAVYGLAYDWNPSLGGQIISHQPDAQTYVVTWQDMRRTGSSMPQSFQIVIKSDGALRANYQAIEAPLPGIIGAESYDGSFSQRVLCNGAGRQIGSGQSVSFDTRLPW